MDSQNEWQENKRPRSRFHCQVCGKQCFSESVRCPECGRICCVSCSIDYHDDEKSIDQKLCKFCNYAKDMLEQEKNKKEAIHWAKIILASLVVLMFLGAVIRWY